MALFPNRYWEGKNGNNHHPTGQQERIYKQFDVFAKAVAQERKGRKMIMIHDGDAIEGVHHNNVDVCTRDVKEQADLHEELMMEFMDKADWQRGDELYYVLGTETHVSDVEHDIAKELGAQQLPDGSYIANHLSLTVRGRQIWMVHEGARAGKGANEGNGLRNWLRDIYYDALKDKQEPPDIIYSGHVHQPTYNVYIANEAMHFRFVHGVILPSWQAKTRYAYRVAPVAKNRIGGMTQVITAEGDIRPPTFYVCETESMMKA